jgi:hypothetical protein
MAYLPTLYKARGVPVKGRVCAICGDRTRGKTEVLRMGYGVEVWLCAGHASREFQTQRSGRDVVLTLHRLWSAHGCLTLSREKALTAHLESLKGAAQRQRPGSYSWPDVRRQAEEAFGAGADPDRVATDLRRRLARGPARPPSVRTFRRWHAERRWLGAAARGAPQPVA